ncbi:MAG: mechanosensitive ion channel [Clostridia bacterium]|nr:mechanosensitive ion channel [Clostridia bacterium]
MFNLFLTVNGNTNTQDPSGTNSATNFLDSIVEFLGGNIVPIIGKILGALAVIIIGVFITRKIAKSIEKGKLFPKMNNTLRIFLKHVIAVVLYIAIAAATISILGFDISALSAAIASAGLAVGLALQGGLSNIAGGVMLVIFKPFEVGDYVEGAGVSGTVVDIGLFYTTLTTPDNKKVVVPNGTISNSAVTNYSAHETRRIDFDFSISYDADIASAKKVLLACARSDERILDDPKPETMVIAHGDTAVGIRLRVWVKNSDYWDVNFHIIELVKLNFDKNGIEIPYPQLDVHLAK